MLAIDWHERSASYDEYKYLTFLTGKLLTDLGDILLANLLQCLNLLGVNGLIYQVKCLPAFRFGFQICVLMYVQGTWKL